MIDRCLIMGIVNRTPDSFFDGGRMLLAAAVDHALRLVDEGADILDLGGVKAGPGNEVDPAEEAERLLPLVAELAKRTEVPLSVETARPAVAERALEAGAAIINDVSFLAAPAMCDIAARRGAGLILMHNGGQVRSRPRHPRFGDIVADVAVELERAAALAISRGVDESAIVFDAGLDFGKTTLHSLELVRRTAELAERCSPLLVAASRKDVVGETLGLPSGERLEGSLALAALAVRDGAAIVRVHDVKQTVRVVKMVEAVVGRRPPVALARGLWD